MEARQPARRRARQPGPDRRARVGPDRRGDPSSGASGPIVGRVGPDFGQSSGRQLSEIALLGFHKFDL